MAKTVNKYIVCTAAVIAASSLTGCRLAPKLYTSRDIIERHLAAAESESAAESVSEVSTENTSEPAAGETSDVSKAASAAVSPAGTSGISDGSSGSDVATSGETAAGGASSDSEVSSENTGTVSGLEENFPVAPVSLSLSQLKALYGQDFTYAWDTPALTLNSPLAYLAQNYLLRGQLHLNLSDVTSEDSMYRLHLHLNELIDTYDGNWSVCVVNLETDQKFVINDSSQPSASVMKLFIMGAVYRAIDEGTLERTDEILSLLSGMISYSSNEAANQLLVYLGGGNWMAGIDAVNDYIASEGYSTGTVEYNGFDNADMVEYPDHVNLVTASDVAEILSRIYHRTFSSRSVCNEAEEWLLNQDTRYKIPRGLPDGVQVGNKTGETSTTENDAAIVYGPGCDYILVVLSNSWESAAEAEDRITEISSEVYRYLCGDGAENDTDTSAQSAFPSLYDALSGTAYRESSITIHEE